MSESDNQTLVGVIGPGADKLADALAAMPGVAEVRPVAPPYPLVSREHHPDSTLVKVEGVTVGGPELIVIAGPCAVESREQIMNGAESVAICCYGSCYGFHPVTGRFSAPTQIDAGNNPRKYGMLSGSATPSPEMGFRGSPVDLNRLRGLDPPAFPSVASRPPRKR